MGVDKVKKVLICRMGTIGDAIIALPSFHLINRVFPHTQKALLSDYISNQKTISIFSILQQASLVDINLVYPCKPLTCRSLVNFIKELKGFNPDIIIYLEGQKSWIKILRDALFFKLYNFPKKTKLFGFKFLSTLGAYRFNQISGLYEYEAIRLLRSIKRMGVIDVYDYSAWDLNLSKDELADVRSLISDWNPNLCYIICSLGTKVLVNHWGVDRWAKLFKILNGRCFDLGLVLIGAACEFNEHEEIAKFWKGSVINLCGKITPRESAALAKGALFFIGHNSGPMHVCASQGIPCVAIFSGRDLPGVWFPFGEQHKVIYHKTDCCGCYLSECVKYNAKCIRSIDIDEVLQAVDEVMVNERKKMSRRFL